MVLLKNWQTTPSPTATMGTQCSKLCAAGDPDDFTGPDLALPTAPARPERCGSRTGRPRATRWQARSFDEVLHAEASNNRALAANTTTTVSATQAWTIAAAGRSRNLRFDDATALFAPIASARPIASGEDAEQTCSICLDDLKSLGRVTALPCSHSFHAQCIQKHQLHTGTRYVV